MAEFIRTWRDDVWSDCMIGILGGTFDPIHNGHIQIAQTVMQTLQLNCVEFIPCFQPPHRHQPIASPQDRLAMVTLAIQSHPNFHVNTLEMDRQGVSYSIDTLTTLRNKMPNKSLCFILGADAFSVFHHWHEWKKISELTHLIIVGRAIAEPMLDPQLEALVHQKRTANIADIKNNLAGKIYFMNNKIIPISATHIRNRIQSGEKNIAELDDQVRQYIFEHQLYC